MSVECVATEAQRDIRRELRERQRAGDVRCCDRVRTGGGACARCVRRSRDGLAGRQCLKISLTIRSHIDLQPSPRGYDDAGTKIERHREQAVTHARVFCVRCKSPSFSWGVKQPKAKVVNARDRPIAAIQPPLIVEGRSLSQPGQCLAQEYSKSKCRLISFHNFIPCSVALGSSDACASRGQKGPPSFTAPPSPIARASPGVASTPQSPFLS